ncbi:MAG TPA: hypothetical protein PLR26_01020, partial [Bacilli bacterium]|nr:hypothetical protein [Bacilli bacterium]
RSSSSFSSNQSNSSKIINRICTTNRDPLVRKNKIGEGNMKKINLKNNGNKNTNNELVIKFSSETTVNPVVLPF